MSWDPIWEEIFSQQDWGHYPPEELIRFTARGFYRAPNRQEVKFLEIGCGQGANMWYLAREGFSAYGMDGSSTVIEKARTRLTGEGLNVDLRVGDALNIGSMYEGTSFDAVLDVGCMQCNRMGAVQQIVDQLYDLLKPDGRFFSVLMATGSSGDGLGTEVEPGTYTDVKEGLAKGRGLNHFFTQEEIQNLFRRFGQLNLDYIERSFANQEGMYRTWIVEAVK
jgi:SAM-dependent methyltransferase